MFPRIVRFSNTLTEAATRRSLPRPRKCPLTVNINNNTWVFPLASRLSNNSFNTSSHHRTPRQEAEQKKEQKYTTPSELLQGHNNIQAPAIQTQFSSTYLIIGIVVAVAGSLFAYNTSSEGHAEQLEDDNDTITRAPILIDNMVALPGRPGNLSAIEEAKLKQFWRMTFEVTGVDVSDVPLPDTASTINEDISSLAGDKRRKSGFFGRRKADAAPADEDKYGQNKDYQDALADTSPDEFREAFWANAKNEHPDAILLRFLRARKWDLQKALVMMISTLQWRKKTMKIEEEIVFKGELSALQDEKSGDPVVSKEGSDFLSQLRKGKSYVHGVDREGRPVTWVRVRLHHGGEQSDTSIERFTVQIFETTRLLIEQPADTGDLFFDMSGFSMANMDYTPVKFMIRCFEANYPESLGVCLIYKAPWIFQGVWKIISRWLDPVVASKIHFTNNVKDLEPYVDRSQIPKEMGGDSPFQYEYIEPIPGENDLLKDTATRKKLEAERSQIGRKFEQLTIEWIKGADVKAQRSAIAQELAQFYWKLDPYIRGRTYYDRLGVLSQNGKIDWSKAIHPEPQKPIAQANGSAGGGAAAGASTGGAAGALASTRQREPDSDTESISSFKTANDGSDDDEGVVEVAKAKSIPNGIAINGAAVNGSAVRGGSVNGNARTGAAATTGGVLGAVTGALGAIGLANGTSDKKDAPVTPPHSTSPIVGLASPAKSIRSTYSNAGTQTWNPKDAWTQTTPSMFKSH